MKILDRIKKEAKKICTRRYRCNHAAFIFRRNSIFAIGKNSHKTHPKIKDYDYHEFAGIHAELDACIKFGNVDCSKYSLAIVRIDRNGNFNQSRPCYGCQSIIRQLNFKSVFFTNQQGEWESYY